MRKSVRVLAIAVLTLGVAAVAVAQEATPQGKPWIHVQVIEDDGDGAKVNVNLPLSLIEVALQAIPDDVFDHHHGHHGHLRLRHSDVSVAELRELWAELKAAGDAEFVEIEDDHELVRVFRRGDVVSIRIDDTFDEEEKVRIDVPFSVVDALLSGEGDELDVAGAVRQISDTMRGDIVTVRDGDTSVRVWIDERN